MMTKLFHCVSLEVRNLPYFDGLTDVDKFFDAFKREVPKKHHFQALDWALRAITARWRGTHKDNFDNWHVYRKMMRLEFGHP